MIKKNKYKINNKINNKIGISCVVSGLVQGVFFRANTEKVAKSLNLTGWVKNLSTGEVEVLAYGDQHNIDQLLEWLRIGSIDARVDNLDYNIVKYDPDVCNFIIIY